MMILVILRGYYTGMQAVQGIQFIIYLIYAAGIGWAILSYRFSPAFTGTFKDLFSQGFRCFIIVTLAMAVFYWVFNARHPEFAETSANVLRERLEKMEGDQRMLPNQINEEVITYKKQYTLKLVSGAIFGYLIIGVIFTALMSALLTRRR